MDMKAMAKSKRSHTQHNQQKKPNNHPQKPTKNPSNLTPKTTKIVPQKPSLPSNWDRYDYDYDDDDVEGGGGVFRRENPADSVSKEGGKMVVSEEIRVKSKGADFGELIAQAKESRQRFSVSPSFGDHFDDFYQGLAPMLEIKSEGVPSWYRDDDFLLENEATTSEEGPNFSLDLKALAEDLAKLDLAKRLFIEPDLLPPELRGVDDNQVPEKRMQTFETFEELYSIYLADEKIAEAEDADKDRIISSSNDPSTSKVEGIPQPSQATEQNTESRSHDVGREVDPVMGHNSVSQPGASMSNLKGNSVTNQAPFPHSRDVSRPAQVTSSLDDELDDLLDASNLNKKGTLFQSIEVKGGSSDYGATQGDPLRNILEDPSKSAFSIRGSLDDELDSLLEETSKPTLLKIDSTVFPSPSSLSSMDPGVKPEVVDDFDSWMDSL